MNDFISARAYWIGLFLLSVLMLICASIIFSFSMTLTAILFLPFVVLYMAMLDAALRPNA